MGNMPSSGFIWTDLNVTGTISTVTRLYGSMYSSDGSCPLPYSHPSNIIYNVQITIDGLNANNGKIGIAVGDSIWADIYHFKAFAVVEYTKTT